MKSLVILNGPNLNLLGKREQGIYGKVSFDEHFEELKKKFPELNLQHFQSNSETELIDLIHEHGFSCDGIILNPAAYTHSSIAIADAVAAIPAPVVEVHISNVAAREEFRQHSYVSAKCKGSITGFGLDSYRLAILSLS